MLIHLRIFTLVFLLLNSGISTGQTKFSSIWLNQFESKVNLDSLKGADPKTGFDKNGFNFTIGSKGVLSRVWGGGDKSKGFYPDEKLTALFIRKIEFREIDLQEGTLSWIFTGPKAGATVTIDKQHICLKQRFYDSYGLLDTTRNIPKLIEHDLIRADIDYRGIIKNISVSVDFELKLKLYVNDHLIASQLCLIDLDRHQLRYSGISGNVQGTLLEPLPEKVKVQINPSKKYQQILGFGGIASIGAYRDLSSEGKEKWWKYIRDYNLLIQREYPVGTQLKEDCSNWDRFEDATIHYYGDNFPNGEISDFTYNKTIQDLGGIVIFEFWDLPPWMINSNTYHDKKMEGADPEKYARTYVNYCRTAKEKTGRAPAIVGIQNERNQSPEMWQKMTLALRNALDQNGFRDVKIHMHNSGNLSGGISALRAFTSVEEVWKKIDYAATNLYDYQQYFTHPDDYDRLITEWKTLVGKKPFISTEICINNPVYQHDSYRLAFQEGQLYYKNLTMMDAEAIIYCWSILNGPHPSFDATRSLFRVDYQNNSMPVPSSHQLRVLGSFSRNIKEGMYRIEVETGVKDLLATCFENTDTRTLVLMNRSTSPNNVSLESNRNKIKRIEVCDPFSGNRTVEPEDFEAGGGIKIMPGQILTLILN